MKQTHRKWHLHIGRERLVSMMMLWPSLVGVLIFFLLPFCVVCYYAVINNPLQHQFVFLKNFVDLLHNSSFLMAVKNTASFSVIAVPLAVVLALGLALLLEARIPGKSQFRTFFLSPMMVPVASIVLIWQVLFHYNGVVNQWLAVFGVGAIDWLKSDQAQVVVILLFLWKNLGYNMILFMASLSNIPRDLLEVADIEAASPWYKFVRIKLRYLSPTSCLSQFYP